MTKAELLAAIAGAPDDALVYVDTNGIWRSRTDVCIENDDDGVPMIVVSYQAVVLEDENEAVELA